MASAMHVWQELAKFGPADFEAFVEKVYAKYNQAFKPVAVNETTREIEIELKDGQKVREKI